MSDVQWQALQDALALGEPAPEGADLDVRAERAWRDELAFYDALAEHMGAAGEAEPGDDAIVAAALAAVPVESRRVGAGWIAAVVSIAAAVLLWAMWPSAVQLRGAEGSWATEAGDTVAAGEVMPAETWLRVEQAACMAQGDARLCADAGSRVRVMDADARQLELAEGAVAVVAGQWSVQLAGQQHTLRAGERLAVETTLAVAPEPAAVEPEPAEAEPEPEPTTEDPASVAGEPKPRRAGHGPRLDAAALVERARKARGEGRLADADRDYSALMRRFPSSSEARVSRVALAQIKLRRGKAKAALRLFDKAAKAGGPLAEEAAWGKLQALQRLGRTSALHEAAEAFVAKYPTSVYRARAQGMR
jgi:TolA-binding protein